MAHADSARLLLIYFGDNSLGFNFICRVITRAAPRIDYGEDYFRFSPALLSHRWQPQTGAQAFCRDAMILLYYAIIVDAMILYIAASRRRALQRHKHQMKNLPSR